MTNTIRCVILDDEMLALTYLKLLCEQIEGVEVVKAFNRPELFLKEIHSIDCDVCIMDIEMPLMNGLEVASKIPQIPIVFTTAYKEYAADAFDLNVVDYVRKPLKKDRLEQALRKVKIRETVSETLFFEWNTGLGKTKISTESVLYIKTSEIDSRDKVAILDDYSELTLKNINFRSLLQLLPKEHFVQINKKEVISIKIIKAFSGTLIVTTLSESTGLPLKLQLSHAYKDAFEKMMKI
mgnify:CR=1 FL=1